MVVIDEPVAAPAASELKKQVTAITEPSCARDIETPAGDDRDDALEITRRLLRVDSLGLDRSSRPHFKEGIRLAEMGKWNLLIDRVASDPQLARHKDHHGMLPLHWACTEDDTPPKAVQALLTAFPEAVITKNNAQYLPIHIAVKARAPLETLRLLVNARPSSMMEETPAGKTVIQLAKEMGLPPGALEMLQCAEQEYLDLNEDHDEAFDYEDVKRDIEMQSQLLRESMMHPLSMSGANASLAHTNPIGVTFDLSSSHNPFEHSQNMVTTLSFVDGALVQSQTGFSKSVSLPRKTESTPLSLVTDTLTPAPSKQTLVRSRSAREVPPAPVSTDVDDSRPIYEPEHNAGVCGVCYKKFSMFRKKYQCKGCFTFLCKKHVAGKIMLPNYAKKRSVCGDCYRIHRNGPGSANTASTITSSAARAARVSGVQTAGSGPPIEKKGPSLRTPASVAPPATATTPQSVPEVMDTISNTSLLVNGGRTSTCTARRTRMTRAESTHSTMGRPSNVTGPQMNMRFSTNTVGARANHPMVSGGRVPEDRTATSDTTMSLPDSDLHGAEFSELQYRIATLEECNKILMTRVADQEKQYNEAMLLLTTTMTRVAQMEIRLPTEQQKLFPGGDESVTGSERASELDSTDKFLFATSFVEKYD
ncbi:hypothetical protein PsorP6_014207 [Peronosclerospora sorghi]|uniref:Uncharacterized protein n=1 Tax=Peronosclerospora sorghi TaxID=230839 RepID=A0ACC0VHG9_9STRA|nr:hypothetical protein PsorP6_014207 [Peronosclerospora sorghi]